MRRQEIELPSWAFGNSGTRFKVFAQAGVARSPYEKLEDAAQVHAFTGVAPRVALHIPWDRVDDYRDLGRAAADLGIELGTINANVFQDDDYMLGSVTHPDPGSGARPSTTCSPASTSWTRPGPATSSCGSPTARTTPGRTASGPGRTASPRRWPRRTNGSATEQRLILEYKLFEPAFYTMDVPDWGTSYAHCLELGPKAKVCVDTGHHAPGTNIEFIVAFLLRAGKLGAFDFNSRFYADDDLMVGAADPFQLFRILCEVRYGGGLAAGTDIAFMLDQCHNIEPKIPGQIRSVMNVQEATAKALLVDVDALTAAQEPVTCWAPTRS